MSARSAGFTLVEVLTATLLFSVIGLAGLVLVTTLSRVNERTEDRLERLAGLERALLVITRDVEHALPGTLQAGATSLAFHRRGSDTSVLPVRYEFASPVLVRAAGQARQILITDLSSVDWQILDGSGSWQVNWPPDEEQGRTDTHAAAVSVTLEIGPAPGRRGGVIRRIIVPPQPSAP
jgi:general secretion pathway protein J